jgi:hypothetical protein
MRSSIVALVLFASGMAMVGGSYLWHHYMSAVVWTEEQSRERISSTSQLHSEISALEQSQLRSQKTDEQIERRVKEAQKRHAAARDEFRRARAYQSIGTHVLRTGGCLFMLAGALTFLFVHSSAGRA